LFLKSAEETLFRGLLQIVFAHGPFMVTLPFGRPVVSVYRFAGKHGQGVLKVLVAVGYARGKAVCGGKGNALVSRTGHSQKGFDNRPSVD
jgi:hypothetical protein